MDQLIANMTNMGYSIPEKKSDSDIGKLMHDFRCKNADEMNFDLMAERTRYLKETKKGASEVSDIMKELQDIAIHKDRVRILYVD